MRKAGDAPWRMFRGGQPGQDAGGCSVLTEERVLDIIDIGQCETQRIGECRALGFELPVGVDLSV